MKPEQMIIYDGACPMCAWYTGVFVNTGLLPADGRQTFDEINSQTIRLIDPDKSRHEIPLVNTQTGEVQYGVDAILHIIGSRFPLIRKIGAVKFINCTIRKVYNLISYNRRVIVAAQGSSRGFDSTPDFNLRYRSALLGLGFFLNSLVLVPLHALVFTNSLFAEVNLFQLQTAHMVFVACNVYVATHFNRKLAFEYLGQINILAITAMLLSLPVILLNLAFTLPPLVNNALLAAILFITIKEYFRRMKYAGVIQSSTRAVPYNIFCLILFLLYLSN